jgi:hypothetical protein
MTAARLLRTYARNARELSRLYAEIAEGLEEHRG